MDKKVRGRHGARWVALQGLYAWAVSGNDIAHIEQDLINRTFAYDAVGTVSFNQAYFQELLREVTKGVEQWDHILQPFLGRSLQDLTPIEHAILRMGIYELKARVEIPYKVIINEAIILAKAFGAQDSHTFINSILDKAAHILRKA